MMSGGSISSENNMDEYPNQSTPKGSLANSNHNPDDSPTSDPNNNNNGENYNENRRISTDKADREGSFANVSLLNPPNGGKLEIQDVETNEEKLKDENNEKPKETSNELESHRRPSAPRINLADAYFEAKQNKFEKPTTEIVINMDNLGKNSKNLNLSLFFL